MAQRLLRTANNEITEFKETTDVNSIEFNVSDADSSDTDSSDADSYDADSSDTDSSLIETFSPETQQAKMAELLKSSVRRNLFPDN